MEPIVGSFSYSSHCACAALGGLGILRPYPQSGVIRSSVSAMAAPVFLRRADPKASLARAIDAAKIIFLGEIHHEPDVLGFQMAVLGAASGVARRPVHVVLEHFACDQQNLLEKYRVGQLSLEELSKQYHATGTEGFDVAGHYSKMLTYGRDKCRFYGGFMPKRDARAFLGGTDAAVLRKQLDIAIERGYLLPDVRRLRLSEDSHSFVLDPATPSSTPFTEAEESGTKVGATGAGADDVPACLLGTVSHYHFFESLIAGAGVDPSITDTGSLPPVTGRFQRIFPAQVIKDLSMASTIVRVLRGLQSEGDDEAKVVAIMGNGHMEYGFGVPERVLALLSQDAPSSGMTDGDILRIVCHADGLEDGNKSPPEERLSPSLFPDGRRRSPADFVYLYEPSAEG